jgi:hypothetical protein
LVAEPPPGIASFADAVEQRHSQSDVASAPPLTGEDDIGTYLTWPQGEGDTQAELAGLDDGGHDGRIYGGRPPGGSFVSRDAVGLHYRSPWLESS